MSRLVYTPQSLHDIARGFEQMSHLLGVTLGPRQGVVVSQVGHGRPEQLTDAGLIAQRITELPDQGENVGAMLVRGMARQMRDQCRDGVATAAVLAGAMLHGALKLVAAGHNPMLIRRGMAHGAAKARVALAAQSQMPAGQRQLEQVVMTAIHNADLSTVLGEMFDVLGPYGAYMVEEYALPRIDREYIEGGRWAMRPGSRLMMPAAGADLTLHNPLIAVFQDKVEKIAQVRPALELASARRLPLLLIAQEVSGEALDTLMMNHAQGRLEIGLAITTVPTPDKPDDLDDLAALVGAQPLRALTGHPAERLRAEWLGTARQITLGRDALTIAGGGGSAACRQPRIAEVQARLRRLHTPDEDWKRLRLRLARLSGGLCILKVGAHTFRDREALKALAEQALRVLELAVTDGIVAGGGMAYLGCIPAVQAAAQACTGTDERAGVQVIASALQAPFARIVANHGGQHPPLALHEARTTGKGFDARCGTYADMVAAGIIDSTAVLAGALAVAVSTATMALTTEVMVLHEG